MDRPRVLVGVTGAPVNPAVVSWGLAEAAGSGRRLVLAHACRADSPLAAPGAAARIALVELVEPDLARAVNAARLKLGGDRVGFEVAPEPPAPWLTRLARPGDLIVVGAPTRPGWAVRRSTTRDLLGQAPGPVVVVRPPGSSGGPAALLAQGGVVVGVDGSAAGRAALRFGFGYAADHRCSLVAAHVTAAEADGGELLAAEVERWRHRYPEVTVTGAVLSGRPVEALARAGAGALLLVVGDSRPGRLRRMLGSVGRGLVDRAGCPVTVVPAGVEPVSSVPVAPAGVGDRP